MPDPAVALRFEVKVDGKSLGSFTGCEGLAAEYEVHEHQEGGENTYIHRIPGRLKYPNIKLTRPVDGDSGAIAQWFAELKSSVKRSTARITAQDGKRQALAEWQLEGVWPVKWTGPTFKADQSGVVTETLELAHHGFVATPTSAGSAKPGA